MALGKFNKLIYGASLVGFLSLTYPAVADEIHFKDRSSKKGNYITATDTEVQWRVGEGIVGKIETYDPNSIESIVIERGLLPDKTYTVNELQEGVKGLEKSIFTAGLIVIAGGTVYIFGKLFKLWQKSS